MLLENIKEKSLEKPEAQPSIISSESIKKLKDKIIGKTETDVTKGKSFLLFFKEISIIFNTGFILLNFFFKPYEMVYCADLKNRKGIYFFKLPNYKTPPMQSNK